MTNFQLELKGQDATVVTVDGAELVYILKNEDGSVDVWPRSSPWLPRGSTVEDRSMERFGARSPAFTILPPPAPTEVYTLALTEDQATALERFIANSPGFAGVEMGLDDD